MGHYDDEREKWDDEQRAAQDAAAPKFPPANTVIADAVKCQFCGVTQGAVHKNGCPDAGPCVIVETTEVKHPAPDDDLIARAATIASQGHKDDSGKARLELISPVLPIEVGRVLAFGAAKYADRNWEKGINYSRIVGSTLRHVFAWIAGQRNDPETGLSHLAHAATNLMFLMHYEANDSRYASFNDLPALKQGSRDES